MDNAGPDNRREYVRAALSTEVRFTVMDAHEYDAIKKHDRRQLFIAEPVRPPTHGDEEDYSTDKAFYPNLIHFLMHMDDKLDRILKVLSKDEKADEGLFVGRSLDISGTGMRILSDMAIKPGQILSIGFRIFRYPVMSLEVYGKVVRVTPVEGQRHEVAVEFLGLDQQCRESIIAYVFQMQREAIRTRKKK